MTLPSVPQMSFTGGEISPSLYGRVDLQKYSAGLRLCKNFIVHRHGGISNRGGLRFACEVKDSSKEVRLIPFQFSVTQAYILEFGDGYMRVIRDGGQVALSETPAAWDVGTTYDQGDHVRYDSVNYYSLQGSNLDKTPDAEAAWWYALEEDIVEIPLPYTEAQLPQVKYTQSADVLFLTHPSHPPRKVSRTGHDSWTTETITFQTSVASPTSFARSAGTGTGNNYVVTAVLDHEESVASTAVTNAGPGDTFTWSHAGADIYNLYKDGNGSGVFGWIGQAASATFKEPVGSIIPDYSRTPPTAQTPFGSANNYPGACTFFQQRLCFARTNNQPQTIWGSVVGSFENMNISSPLQADDSYEFTINALQVNDIKAMIPLEEMVILTSGTEWKMEAGSQSDAVTPNSVKLSLQSKWGASDVPPLLIGQTMLYVQTSGNIVRDLLYSLEVDGYTGNDLSLMAEHLFRDQEIVDWSYQQFPNSIVWAVRGDGTLLGMTYAREHEVWAWHQHDTDGLFEATATTQGGGSFEETYFVIAREIEGSTKRYIEYFTPRIPGRQVENSFFVDSGLTYDVPVDVTNLQVDGTTKVITITAASHGFSNGDPIRLTRIRPTGQEIDNLWYQAADVATNTFTLKDDEGEDYIDGTGVLYTGGGEVRKGVVALSGLDHLEGKTLVALADGSVVWNLVVEAGAVALERYAGVIHVGLPYIAEAETMELDLSAEGGTLQDRKRDVVSLVVRLQDSREFWAGPNKDRIEELRFRQYEDYGESIALFTGDKEMSVYSGEERSAKVYFRNVDPVPCTVLAVIPKIVSGEY